MTLSTQWEIEDFKACLHRKMLATGRAAELKSKRVDTFIAALSEGYASGRRGNDLYRYARNEAVGMNLLVWIQLFNLLWSIYTFYIEWKNRRQTVATKDFE